MEYTLEEKYDLLKKAVLKCDSKKHGKTGCDI